MKCEGFEKKQGKYLACTNTPIAKVAWAFNSGAWVCNRCMKRLQKKAVGFRILEEAK